MKSFSERVLILLFRSSCWQHVAQLYFNIAFCFPACKKELNMRLDLTNSALSLFWRVYVSGFWVWRRTTERMWPITTGDMPLTQPSACSPSSSLDAYRSVQDVPNYVTVDLNCDQENDSLVSPTTLNIHPSSTACIV